MPNGKLQDEDRPDDESDDGGDLDEIRYAGIIAHDLLPPLHGNRMRVGKRKVSEPRRARDVNYSPGPGC